MEKYYKIEVNYPRTNNTWKGWEDYFSYENKYYTLELAEDMIEFLKRHFEKYAAFDQPKLRIAEYTIKYIGE